MFLKCPKCLIFIFNNYKVKCSLIYAWYCWQKSWEYGPILWSAIWISTRSMRYVICQNPGKRDIYIQTEHVANYKCFVHNNGQLFFIGYSASIPMNRDIPNRMINTTIYLLQFALHDDGLKAIFYCESVRPAVWFHIYLIEVCENITSSINGYFAMWEILHVFLAPTSHALIFCSVFYFWKYILPNWLGGFWKW